VRNLFLLPKTHIKSASKAGQYILVLHLLDVGMPLKSVLVSRHFIFESSLT